MTETELNTEKAPPTATLLCVDDEQNILASLRRLFRPLGYNVLLATSGAEGLAILEKEPVDLVISDMRMPQMDGAQFLEQVAQRWPAVTRMLLTGFADINSTIAAINKGQIYGYFSKPWEDNEIKLAVQHALERKRLKEERDQLLALTERQNAELKDLNANLEQKVQARTEEVRQTNMFLELAYQQLEESYYETIPIFANLVQLREGPRGGHGKRVAELAREVAQHMGMDDVDARHVYFAGLLHDIGKLGMPDDLLRIPYARLNANQRKVMNKHPATGQAVLMGLEPLQTTATYIRSHHETFDGKGFPDGLFGEHIRLGARILMVVNEYDGLRTGAFLGEDFTQPDALGFMRERAGKRYDPAVVEALAEVLARRDNGGTLRELRLSPAELVPGMVLSRDFLNPDGVLMLTKGYRLNAALIAKVDAFAQDEESRIIVHIDADSVPAPVESAAEESSQGTNGG